MLSDSALKKIGCFIGGVLCKESVHELYSSSVAGKGLCNEDSYCYTGECRRYSC